MGWGWLCLAMGLGALAFAVVFGGREERIFVAVQAASGLLEHGFVHFGRDVVSAILIDMGVLAAVLPLALRSDKVWPLFAASVCVATLATEAAQLLVHAAPTAYGIIEVTWDLLADMTVALGAWSLWQGQRRLAGLAAATGKAPAPHQGARR